MSDCPRPVELEAYLDVGSEVGIGAHVRACPTCQARIREIQANQDFLKQIPTPAAMTDQHPDAPPGYRLVRVLGRGGQAVVYEALQAGDRAEGGPEGCPTGNPRRPPPPAALRA